MNLWKVGSALLLAGLLVCQRGNAWNVSSVVTFSRDWVGLPRNVSVGDFDNDGHKDVLMTMENAAGSAEFAGTVMLFRQQADGKLAQPVAAYRGASLPEIAVDHAAADLNRDGLMDLVVANFDAITTLIAQPGGGHVRTQYERPGNVTWHYPAVHNKIVLHDVDGDGQRDILMFAWWKYAAAFLLNPDGSVRSSRGFLVPTEGYNDFAVGDVDHDGKDDLVSSSAQGLENHLVVYGPDGQGGLAVRAAWTNSVPINSIAIGDFDHDELQEIMYTAGGNAPAYVDRILLDPDLNIAAFQWEEAGQQPYGLVAGDINADGLDDAAFYNNSWRGVGVFLQSEGRLLPMVRATIDSNTWDPDALAIGDVNGDGCPDLVMGEYENYLLQVLPGHACKVSPLPTVDYGMALKALPMQPVCDCLPGAYSRTITASLNVYSGGEVKIQEPKVYIRLTARPGYSVKVTNTSVMSGYHACSIAESTRASALVVCSPTAWVNQTYFPKIDFAVGLDDRTDTKVKVDAWVESGSETRREIFDTVRRNQSATMIANFVAPQPPPACTRNCTPQLAPSPKTRSELRQPAQVGPARYPAK